MNQPVQSPNFSTTRLVLALGITVIAIIVVVAMLTKDKHINRRSALVPIYREDTEMAGYPFADSISSIDTTGKDQAEAKMPAGYYESLKEGRLQLYRLNARQIIKAISQYKRIPVVYKSEKLSKKDNELYDGDVNLSDKIESITATLKAIGVKVSYDGKSLIAGE